MAADMKSTPWADQPFKLITTPSKYKDVNSHSSVYCASEMAYSHNCLLRGLNSIMLQAPAITESGQSGYKSEDVQDLLFFVESWVKTVDHHHHTEETTMFPMIEEMAGSPGLLSGPQHQHEEFHDGLESLGQYAAKTQGSPADYKWETMKKIIDGFAPSLTQHLYEEIDVFLSFDRLDSAGLRVCWDKAEEVAKANGKIAFLYDIFPCVLGCCDKTYEGGNSFPPLPGVIPYAIKYWFGAYRPGAWRFNPCDFWGQPKPLHFLTQVQSAWKGLKRTPSLCRTNGGQRNRHSHRSW